MADSKPIARISTFIDSRVVRTLDAFVFGLDFESFDFSAYDMSMAGVGILTYRIAQRKTMFFCKLSTGGPDHFFGAYLTSQLISSVYIGIVVEDEDGKVIGTPASLSFDNVTVTEFKPRYVTFPLVGSVDLVRITAESARIEYTGIFAGLHPIEGPTGK